MNVLWAATGAAVQGRGGDAKDNMNLTIVLGECARDA